MNARESLFRHVETLAPTQLVTGSAYISDDGRYRYSLTRRLFEDEGNGTCTFVMLNPSTADAPTIRRCIAAWGAHAKPARVQEILSCPIRPHLCLGVTKAGAPRHPLYLKGDLMPRPLAGESTEEAA